MASPTCLATPLLSPFLSEPDVHLIMVVPRLNVLFMLSPILDASWVDSLVHNTCLYPTGYASDRVCSGRGRPAVVTTSWAAEVDVTRLPRTRLAYKDYNRSFKFSLITWNGRSLSHLAHAWSACLFFFTFASSRP